MTLNFKGTCDDPDLIYNDLILFTWRSNISKILGYGETLENVTLPIGKHTITLEASDLLGEKSEAEIIVSILETPQSDTDSDGIPNYWERAYGLDPLYFIDSLFDLDNDGLMSIDEFENGTDPQNPDTDNDTYSDGVELGVGTDPLDPEDYPGKEIEDKISEPEWDILWLIIILMVVVVIIVIVVFVLLMRRKPDDRVGEGQYSEAPDEVQDEEQDEYEYEDWGIKAKGKRTKGKRAKRTRYREDDE
jgi:hypothetical protein